MAVAEKLFTAAYTKGINEEERSITAWASRAIIDRDKEIIKGNAWDLKSYRKHPIIILSHNYRDLTDSWVGKTLWIKPSEEGLLFKAQLATTEAAREAFQLVKDTGIAAFSVGFIPKKWIDKKIGDMTEEEKEMVKGSGLSDEDKVRIYTKCELLEISLVSVPACSTAVLEAYNKGKIKTKELQDKIKETIEIIDEEENEEEEEEEEKIIDDEDEEGEAIKIEDVEKPYPGEHACRLRSPGDFQPGSFRRMTRRSDGKEYSIIMGRLKGETTLTEQAYRYGIKIWTVSEARKHCKDHKGIEFSPATGKESEGMDIDKELDNVITKFAGSPRNPFGTHCSFRFKGGIAGYKKSWTLHVSQINGGALTPAASGPIRGTVRRIAMISAGMKPPCKVAEAEGMGARGGAKSPLPGTYPQKPSDYGLSSWLKPGEEGVDREKALQFTCSDLNIIKRICVMEIKRRIKDREAAEGKGMSEEEIEFFEGLKEIESMQEIKEKDEKEEKDFNDLELPASMSALIELVQENEGLKEKIKELELKAGAVLNRKNKTDLKNAQKLNQEADALIQSVLDSAETSEEGKTVYECECLKCGWKHTSEKHCDAYKCEKCGGEMRRISRPGPGKEVNELEIEEPAELEIEENENKEKTDNTDDKDKEETIEIDEKELIKIIHSTLEEQINKSAESISKNLKQDIDNNFKKMTGKVM